jgi:hypothetical protein
MNTTAREENPEEEEKVKRILLDNSQNIAEISFFDENMTARYIRRPIVNCFHPENHTFQLSRRDTAETVNIFWRNIVEICLDK